MRKDRNSSPDGRPTRSGSHALRAGAEELRVTKELRKESRVGCRDLAVGAILFCFCPFSRAPRDGTRLAAPRRGDRRKVRFTHLYICNHSFEPNFVDCANPLAGNWSWYVSRINAYIRFLGVCLCCPRLAPPCFAFTRLCFGVLLLPLRFWLLGPNRIYGLWGGDETTTDHLTNLKFLMSPITCLPARSSALFRALPFCPHLSGRWEGRGVNGLSADYFYPWHFGSRPSDYPTIH